jgi:hypothetical protein
VEIAGLILATPGLWAYTVIIFVLFPIAAFKRIQEIGKSKKFHSILISLLPRILFVISLP